jgi:hypothetical protein
LIGKIKEFLLGDKALMFHTGIDTDYYGDQRPKVHKDADEGYDYAYN